jgi:AcrR family transcriptional regulator
MATGSRTKNRAVRAEKSRATRLRIVAAASELFAHDGYLQTTMADIARAADVAVQTLYLSFGSKVAVLAAALDIAIAGDDDPIPVIDRPSHARLRDEPDCAQALRMFVAAGIEIIERVYPLYAVLRAAAADPELAELLDRNKRLRFTTYETVMREMANKTGFDRRLSVRRATEILYTVLSEETYGLLVIEHSWTAQDWSEWAHRSLRAELLTT